MSLRHPVMSSTSFGGVEDVCDYTSRLFCKSVLTRRGLLCWSHLKYVGLFWQTHHFLLHLGAFDLAPAKKSRTLSVHFGATEWALFILAQLG